MTAPTSTTHLEVEIATQPDDWRRAARTAAEHAGLLPRRGERVAVVGCGTSFHMAQSYAALREATGQGITDAWSAGEHRLERGYDQVLVLTRSGTTTEVIDLLATYRGTVRTTVVTATAGSPVAGMADVILTQRVDEQSVVQTRFATTTLAMLRSHLGEDIEPAARQAQDLLAAGPEVLGPAVDADQVTFVGHGWTVGLAHEAALKLRESAQFWTESYPMGEFRHGPISVTSPGRVVWAFGTPLPGLSDDVRVTGGHFEHAAIDPLADLVRVHRLCLVKAAAAGLDPDRPRHLSRSVILGT